MRCVILPISIFQCQRLVERRPTALWPVNRSTRRGPRLRSPSGPVRASVHCPEVRFRPTGRERSSHSPHRWGSEAQAWRSSRPRRPAFSGPRRPQRPSRAAFEWPPFFSPRHARRPKAPRPRWLAGAARRPRRVGPGDWAVGEVWAPRGRRHRRRGGGGERFSAAARPGPSQWTAAARALGLCRSEPATRC